MAAIVSPKLDLLTERIKAKGIPWEAYARAGFVSNEDVSLISKVSGTRGKAEVTLSEDTESYAGLFVRLLRDQTRADTLGYVLACITDMLTDHEERTPVLLRQDPTPALAKHLDSQDEYVRLKSAALLSTLAAGNEDVTNADSTRLIVALSDTLRSASSDRTTLDAEVQSICLQCAGAIFRNPHIRQLALTREISQSNGDGAGTDTVADGKLIADLVALLRYGLADKTGTLPPQIQYQLGLAFWLLSYERRFCENAHAHYGLVTLLADILKNASKEKVARVVLATFRNLATKAPEETLSAMLLAKVLPHLQQLTQSKQWSDEEIKEDNEWLIEQLKEAAKSMTTYDEYVTELNSGELTWSPPHESVEFWQENAKKLADKSAANLKTLLDLLEASEPEVRAIACNDIGQFVKYFDGGKKLVTDHGGKSKIFELLNSPDPSVKYRALITVQRLISEPWTT
ncbi:uncharacterized protein L969DRAFT_45628 [Mixia osmundae IAM 14324]|uniref:V-type proton ATPase subunit H n=1 Tax=Mixia osmundae (strain CBS 9802 / IAM 14324 / JCM 22182 / KY 12970) TaxID=764103 RepID=G7DTU4_MIXOS|nr:uncharacterized protein L969DRAFT_45628 [Mixia osmundae IAM 14324]KEI41718.1 hypothetical protein L969DRAFT_45628 [Mixia osmundae IAM 14324]GAA94004.1 hypothetical protein E5Q_00651 [Mixia osmundae IAM 14324]